MDDRAASCFVAIMTQHDHSADACRLKKTQQSDGCGTDVPQTLHKVKLHPGKIHGDVHQQAHPEGVKKRSI